jgi:hypothetical protein
MSGVVLWQRIEGALVFVAAIGLLLGIDSGMSWWLALILFFAPDISFAAYLAGPRIGAFIYNAVHIYALGAVLITLGFILAMPLVAALGALWLGHSGFDRMFGYGLKHADSFKRTHLGDLNAG